MSPANSAKIKLIYYCVDEYTAFTGAANGFEEIEEDLFRRADIVVVSAKSFSNRKKQFNDEHVHHPARHRLGHFRTALDDATVIPDEIADLPKPVIGFHGLLADWIDYELIKKIAEHFSHGSVVLIGKIAVDAEKKIKILDGVHNIHLLGRKPYASCPPIAKDSTSPSTHSRSTS